MPEQSDVTVTAIIKDENIWLTQKMMAVLYDVDAPDGKIEKSDVTIAKNYLTEYEMSQLNRMVTSYLDFAENMALRKIPLTMQDWEQRLNGFIEMFQYGLLKDAGKVTAEIAKLHAETEFEKYMLEFGNEEILD